MFIVIYSFKVKEGREKEFRALWAGLTSQIYKYEGSLGSRLHLSDEGIFIAYAQWPDRKTWKNSGNKLPAKADSLRDAMRNCYDHIQVLYKLTLVDDLLTSETNNSGT